MVAEKIEDTDADIALRLQFTKARQRRRETRDDYEAVTVLLKDNVWTSEPTEGRPDRKQGDYALDLLRRAIEEGGECVPGEANSVLAVPLTLWANYCETYDLSLSDTPDSRTKAFARAMAKLQRQKKITTKRKKVWITQN